MKGDDDGGGEGSDEVGGEGSDDGDFNLFEGFGFLTGCLPKYHIFFCLN